MIKLLIICSCVLISACSSLTNFQEQPVVQLRDNKMFKTTCSGMAEDWGSCHRKAKRTCVNGYDVTDKTAESNGIVREMVFTCK